jgi:PrtD family type I secretion system ABC transporter
VIAAAQVPAHACNLSQDKLLTPKPPSGKGRTAVPIGWIVFPDRKLTDPVRDVLDGNGSLLWAGVLFSAVNSILALNVSLYMLQVYDRVLTSRSQETLLLLTVMAAAVLVAFAFLDSVRARLLARLALRVSEKLGARTLRACVTTASVTADPSLHQGLHDVEIIRAFLSGAALAALLDTPFLLLFLVLLFLLHWAYFVIVSLGGLVLAALAYATAVTARPAATRAIAGQIAAQGFADDGLRNATTLEGLGMSDAFVARWRAQWLANQQLALSASDREAAGASISRAVRQLIQILLLGTGALLVLNFQATGGIMIAASILGSRALAPIEQLIGARRSLLAARLACKRLSILLDRAPLREDVMPLPAPTARIAVQNISYVVPGNRSPLLAHLNFAIEPGELLCVTGPSGSGKSTFGRILIGALRGSSGVVRLDGADISTWPRRDLGLHVGYMPQDVELLAGTVRENIARLRSADSESVVRAARQAQAHDMILALSDGYDTDVGAAGHHLSGGQRQRIGLARALYGDPCLVVLDEPDSNLDAAGEAALKGAIRTLKARGAAIILIAHRQNLMSAVDKLLVLRPGAPALFGPREALLRPVARTGPDEERERLALDGVAS